MDDQIIKDFESKLQMFEKSLQNISDNFLGKLNDLSHKTNEIAVNKKKKKKMKTIYDQQNNKLERMESTIDELMTRLDNISSGEVEINSKKKKKKKKK